MNVRKPLLGRVVCVCQQDDIETWRSAALRIVSHIQSRHYVLLVPDAEVQLFRSVSPSVFDVIAESSYARLFLDELMERMPTSLIRRKGWYVQQLLKLCALYELEPDEVGVIWDADTVPLKQLSFVDRQGRVTHYCGSERQESYFRTTERLLGLPKQAGYSFIAQCLPVKGQWMQEFRESIEQRHGCDWLHAIIRSINFDDPPGFSEYETLGSFCLASHSDAFVATRRSWTRHGKLLVGDAASLSRWWARLILMRCDFVSFEKWEPSFGGGSGWVAALAYAANKVIRRVTRQARRVLGAVRGDPSASVAAFLAEYFQSPALKYVVQVGANDGLQSDPLRRHLTQPGRYRAMLVEPLPHYANGLREMYAGRDDVVVIECAAGPQEGRADLFFIDPAVADRMNGDGPMNGWAHGQGSLDRSSVEYWIRANAFRGAGYRKSIPEYIASIRVASVPIMPLSSVMDRQATNVLLCIDVQGRELDVLLGVDWAKPPRYVLYEDDRGKGAEVERFLVGKGYRYLCGKNDKVYECDIP